LALKIIDFPKILGVGRHNNQLKNPRKCDFFAKLCIDANVSLIDA
jgi:hypothetical protein